MNDGMAQMMESPGLFRRFRLWRWSDETGISNTGHIASGVQFEDGTCVMRWLTDTRSTAFYGSREDLVKIHGHGMKTVVYWLERQPEAWIHGRDDCTQDSMENVPFGSVGGKESRPNLTCPDYISKEEETDYLHGYICAAIDAYGIDWATCTFEWSPAMTINPTGFRV